MTCPLKYLSKGLKSPLPGGEKSPCKYSARGANSQPRIDHSADLGKLPIKCFPQGKFVLIWKVKTRDYEQGKKISSVTRARRTKSKKRRRVQKKNHRATTNLTERMTNWKKRVRKRTRLTRHAQNRAQHRHDCRDQGTWPDIRSEQQTRRKKKIRKGTASSRRRTLLGEVTAGKKKARQGHAQKGQRTWPGMQQG